MDGPSDHDLLIRIDERVLALTKKVDQHLGNHRSEKRAIRAAVFGAFGAIAAAIGSWLGR